MANKDHSKPTIFVAKQKGPIKTNHFRRRTKRTNQNQPISSQKKKAWQTLPTLLRLSPRKPTSTYPIGMNTSKKPPTSKAQFPRISPRGLEVWVDGVRRSWLSWLGNPKNAQTCRFCNGSSRGGQRARAPCCRNHSARTHFFARTLIINPSCF